MLRKLAFSLLLISIALCSKAQLTVTGGYTAQQLASFIAGPNIQVFNASIIGASNAYGKFNAPGVNLGVTSGVLLTSGSIQNALAPNNSGTITTINNTPGDTLLTRVAGAQTYDAVVLQFQFQVQSSEIQFQYVFGSDEYLEPAGWPYYDVFALTISGPGINGNENLAVVPNSTIPVTINTINDYSCWQYYRDNPPFSYNYGVNYDGFTTLLTAKKTGLIPCQTYTLRLAIADAFDDTWDAGVFLQENSLVQGTVSAITNTVNADSVALEGCTRASFTFSLSDPKPTDTQIVFDIQGSAINGVDYNFIDSVFTIPAGQTNATVFIDPLNDGITEGREVVKLVYKPLPCSTPDTVLLYIDDTQPLSFSLSGTDLTCNGDSSGQISINASGGFPAYSYSIVGGQSYTTSPITNLPAGTYVLRVDDSYGCKASAVTIGSSFDAGATFLPDGNGQSYTSSLVISGFGAGQTLSSVGQLQSICAELEHSSCGEVKIELIAPDGTTIVLKQSSGGGTTDFGEPVAKGPIDGANSDITPGKGYDYCFTTSPTYGTMMNETRKYKHTYVDNTGRTLTDFYLPSGSYQSYQSLSGLIGVPLNGTWTLKVTDGNPQDNGYIFNWGISLRAGMPDSTITIVEPVKPAIPASTTTIAKPTCGSSNGGIDITVSGSTSPYSYLWSTGAVTQDITNIAAGSYLLHLTDNNSCTYDTTFLVANQSAQTLTETHTNVSCTGGSNGGINLSVSGGASPYTFLWSNNATTEDLNNLLPGTYSVEVTDQNGCKALLSVEILQTPALNATAVITNETCANENGIIDLSPAGGTAPYTYLWSTTETTQDIQFLQAGNYSVTIRDVNNCSVAKSYSIINEVNNCASNCTLALGSSSIIDEACGGQNGSIDITVSSGVQPYSFQWSNGATTEDLANISTGTYTVTVTDVNNCQVTANYTVKNNTGTLNLSTPTITNETCGNTQGSINISVSGGAMPYSFNWSNSTTTEDISGLTAGTYSLLLSDANNCAISATYNIINNAGTLALTFASVFDEYCGNNQGSIDIAVAGGQGNYSYLWSNGSSTQDLLNLNAGSYTCVISDAANCKITTPTYVVNNNAGSLAIFDIDIADEICGNGQGRINIDMTGGQIPYTYQWSSGQITRAISPIPAGTYSCTIRDQNGCSVSSGPIAVLNSSGTLSLDAVSSVNETCNNNLGSIDISISGGGTPYTFSWNTGSSSEDLNNLNEGSYSCVITDTSGCRVNANATIINSSGTLALSNKIITNESCGDTTGAIDLVLSGGSVPYSFSWSNGANTEDINTLSAGTYTCLISDAGGCEINTSAIVQNPTGTLALGIPAVTNEVCGNAGGSVNINVSGGTTPYSFAWSNGATTEDISGVSAGTYSCQITDGSGCNLSTGNITINNSAPGLITSLNSITNESCGNLGGAININVSGGTLPYSYAWSNGAITQDISGVAAGTYTVTVGSAGGCSLTKTYTVLNNSGSLSVSKIVSDEVCTNGQGSINLTVSGGASPYSFNWNNGSVTEDLNNLSAGTFFCTVTDNNGCSVNTGSLNINNSSGSLILNNVSVTNSQCSNNDGQVDINISGGTAPITYSWSNSANTQDLVSVAPGNYTCVISDNAGCSVTASASVMQNAGTLNVIDAVVTNSTCGNSNGSIDLSVGGGTTPYSFLWSNGALTEDINGLAGNTYNCVISDNAGCSITKTVNVGSLGNNLAVTNISVTDESCSNNGGQIDISVSGGSTPYSYAWSSGQSTEDITGLTAGTYNCVITEANGCSQSVSANVVNGSGTLTANSVNSNTSCGQTNGSVNLTVSGGNPNYFYSWSNGASTQDISNLAGGTYTCTISDLGGCVINYSTTIASSTSMVLSSIYVNELCGNAGGSIDLTVTGGTLPYSYNWSNGSSTEDISGLPAGTYTCNINDLAGCFKAYTVNLIDSAGTLVVTDTITNAVCGDATGAIDLNTTGGNGIYTYSWSNGSNTEDLTGLTAGTYTCSVTDGNGCRVVKTLPVSGFASTLDASNATSVPALCGNPNGSLSVAMSGGTTPYSYQWSNNGTTPGITGLTAGIYSCTVIDAGGCSIFFYASVADAMDNLSVSSIITSADVCAMTSGTIDISLSGGVGPYSYLWSNGEVTQDINSLAAGIYSCTITDGNSCSITKYIPVDAGATYTANASITNASCSGCSDGSINLTVSASANLPLTFSWSNGSNTEDISNLSPGTYVVTITDASGCSLTKVFNVSSPTGVNEAEDDLFNIYPNPVTDIVYIKWGNTPAAKVLIEVSNILGEVVYKNEPFDFGSAEAKTIDLNQLNNGTYLLTIKTSDRRYTRKITILK